MIGPETFCATCEVQMMFVIVSSLSDCECASASGKFVERTLLDMVCLTWILMDLCIVYDKISSAAVRGNKIVWSTADVADRHVYYVVASLV